MPQKWSLNTIFDRVNKWQYLICRGRDFKICLFEEAVVDLHKMAVNNLNPVSIYIGNRINRYLSVLLAARKADK